VVNHKRTVDNISIQVHQCDSLAIIGPSGAGKSSFLRMINRLDESSGGTVYLEGRDSREIPPQELQRRLGMVMQMRYLFPGTISDNIRFGPQQRGELVSQDDIESLLSQVGLAGYSDQGVNHLSGGEAQRVSLARTMANSPQILLLDEPTSSLDEASRDEVEK